MGTGRKIGRYQVLGKLGKGGMGSVYKVIDPERESVAALKILDPFEVLEDVLGKEKIKEIFTTEARLMARLQSPYVVEVFDFDHDENDTPFFVMEFYCNNLGLIIGEHYKVEKCSRTIPPEKAIHFGSEILKGLKTLHEFDIVHRDVKPYNILVSDYGTIKICDFGLSKDRNELTSTPAGLRVGSPYYAAPEQEKNPDDACPRSDLYSVGVLLYRMLTGELPSMKNFSLSLVNPLYDQKWDAFFAKAINLQKDQRFNSASQMLEELNALHLHWEKAKRLTCDIHFQKKYPDQDQGEKIRTTPLRVSGRGAISTFEVNDLFQPKHLLKNDFVIAEENNCVIDRKTELVWQTTGSDMQLDYEQAKEYVGILNEQKFAGNTSWRLPTVNELLSLANYSQEYHDYCAPHYFDAQKVNCWSADWRSETTAWYVNTDMAFVQWQDVSCVNYVKAVCGQKALAS